MSPPGEPAAASVAATDGQPSTLADWRLAERLAVMLATSAGPTVGAERGDRLRRQLHDTVAEADPIARRAAGLGQDLSPADSVVVGRAGWIRTNIATLAWMTDPVADRLLRRSGLQRTVTRRAMAAQVGVLLGYLATRVLGQYEALRPPPAPGAPAPAGRLLLVGPNLLAAGDFAEQQGVARDELYRGVILHELAHRLQFESVAWLRPHLHELLDAYLEDTRVDTERLRQIAQRLPQVVTDPSRVRDPKEWLGLVLTPTQVDVLERAQSLMTVLEGHGNAVMEWGAADAGALEPARVRELLRQRRGRMFDKLARDALGLSMKAEQYAVGERFVLDVADRHGLDAVNRVWQDPARLPSSDELERPDDWVSRVKA